jgi:FkbM family methyltransferase
MLSRALGKLTRDKKRRIKRRPSPVPANKPYLDADTQDALRRPDNYDVSRYNTIIDVGASDGRWSREVGPNKNRIFIEPNEQAWPTLKAGVNESVFFNAAWDRDNESLKMLTLGNKWVGEVWEDPEGEAPQFDVRTIRVDTAVKQSGFPGPYWLKLDCHGSEWKAICGCDRIWDQIVGINIEMNNFQITPSCVPMLELMQALRKYGFRLYWGGHPTYLAGCLWELECIFLRADHPIFDEALTKHRRMQYPGR